MKTTRLFLLLFLCAAAAGIAVTTRAAERNGAHENERDRGGERAGIQAILISASNERGETDRRLAPYESTLRRILRFEGFRFLGEDSTVLAVGGRDSLSIGDGQRLDLETDRVEGRAIHVRVRWTAGGRTLMNTGLVLNAGVPAVLGGPSTGNRGEVYAVILVGR